MTDIEIVSYLNERIRHFRGDVIELERAIGAYIVGRQVGWKALWVVHDLETINRFERLLGLKFDEPAMQADCLLPPDSVPWLAELKVDAFWGAVMSEAGRARHKR